MWTKHWSGRHRRNISRAWSWNAFHFSLTPGARPPVLMPFLTLCNQTVGKCSWKLAVGKMGPAHTMSILHILDRASFSNILADSYWKLSPVKMEVSCDIWMVNNICILKIDNPSNILVYCIFLNKCLFSYTSSPTPHPCQWLGEWVIVSTSVASRLASLF